MDTHEWAKHDKARLTLRSSHRRNELDGAWWPRSRVLGEELLELFAAWPLDAGYISRVIFAPRDWDDQPSTVEIPFRRGRVKTGHLPGDVAHHVVLILLDGQHRSLVVVPPAASEETAMKYLHAFDPHDDLASAATAE